MTDRRVFSVSQAAEYLNCSASQVRRLLARNALPTIPNMGRRVLMRDCDLDAFIDDKPCAKHGFRRVA